jgi:hypothetical protein
LLSQIPIGQLAQQPGVDEQTAEQAAQQALPALLSGMQASAADPAGAASLTEALGQHDDDLLDGGIDFKQVDTVDGDKIVSNVFGDNRDQVINQLGGMGGRGGFGNIIAKVLPMLAPLLMTYLAKQFGQLGGAGATASATGGAGAGGLEDLLGGQGGQAVGSAICWAICWAACSVAAAAERASSTDVEQHTASDVGASAPVLGHSFPGRS